MWPTAFFNNFGRGRQGQSIAPGYVLTFFLVISAIVAMSVYVQRTMQARIYDTRNHMVGSVDDVCDENCRKAAGVSDKVLENGDTVNGQIPVEYEPYYTQVEASTQRNSDNKTRILASKGRAGIYNKEIDEHNEMTTTSVQLPPRDAK
jgi:hypothetical protein